MTCADAFEEWAEVYDSQPNPLLSLEQRILPALLPCIEGLDILDVGCGTGRWLRYLSPLAPKSLTGIDPSAAMLDRARARLGSSVELHQGDADRLPRAEATADLVLASFVLSYIADLPQFAAECARILRPGGHLLLSDMHPVTARERRWSRSFRSGERHVELTTHTHSLPEVVAAFDCCGFRAVTLTEPVFGEPEHALFAQAGRSADSVELESTPAIYVLKLERRPLQASTQDLCFTHTVWSEAPERWNERSLSTVSGVVSLACGATTVELSGYVLLPGLVNAHDHLEFALYPNLGRGPNQVPFRSSPEWAEEIHRTHAALIGRHRRVPLATRLSWGAVRNLLCGVTTVCHHNLLYPKLVEADFPVRVVRGFGWAHSLTYGEDLAERFHATPANWPFLLHAAEGVDSASRAEVETLHRRGLLDARTVLIHGLGLMAEDVDLLNRSKTALVLCPSSNQYLFGQTVSAAVLAGVDRLALGSDSPLTAAGDLLDEVALLRRLHGLDAETLWRLVTTGPAEVLRLGAGAGRIVPGEAADLIAVRSTGMDPAGTTPAETLARLTYDQVEMVVIGGQVQMASGTLYERLPEACRSELHCLEVEGHRRWLRAPLPELFGSAEEVLGKDCLRVGGKEVRYRPAL